MTQEKHPDEDRLIKNYQNAWRIEGEHVKKLLDGVDLNLIKDPDSAQRLVEGIWIDIPATGKRQLEVAKDALDAIGIDRWSNKTQFIIDTPEFKMCSEQTNRRRDLEDRIRVIGKERLIETGNAQLKTMNADTPILDFALAKYRAAGIEVNSYSAAHVQRIIDDIANKNVSDLVAFLGNKDNKVSTAIFERLTGVKLPKTSRDTLTKIDEWAGITPEVRAELTAKKEQARAVVEQEKEVDYRWGQLKTINVKKPDSSVLNGQDWTLEKFKEGFTNITSKKVGAATRYDMKDGENHLISLRAREFTDFIKAAHAYGGMEEALHKVGAITPPPKMKF